MKIAKRIILIVALIASVATAQAQFRFGVKAGVAINELKFNESAFNSGNRAGFTGGVMAEFTVPVIGVGCDASVMYARRSFETVTDNTTSHKSNYKIPKSVSNPAAMTYDEVKALINEQDAAPKKTVSRRKK